ncbi:MAG: beta-propeller domain-containing protein [Candidatus Peribacteria bacterium]|nr:beta-propeller domain-containing protein [Candidatus Peribacteria bacterium]
MSYSLPDADTIKHFNLSPSYNVISIIDTANSNAKVTTNVIAGSTNEVYMSLDNLYLTSYLYKNGGFGACPK